MQGMLTAVIVSDDPQSSASLRAALQQTGLVASVTEWEQPSRGEWTLNLSTPIPEVLVLDLPRDPDSALAFASQVRRQRPTANLIACSPLAQPDSALLLQAMRIGVQEFLPKPVQLLPLKEALTRFLQARGTLDVHQERKLIAVMGTKGGVGTTTVTVNLGVQLCQATKKKVLVLDFARPMGQVSLMLDLKPRFSIRDAMENLERLDSHFLEGLLERHKSGLQILGGSTFPDDWQRVTVPALIRLLSVAEVGFDFILIDLGTLYSSEWKPVLESARAILIVAEASVPSLWPLERHLIAFNSYGVDPTRLHVIINRWHKQDDETIKSVEKLVKRSIFARLPNDYRQVSESTNMGVPLGKEKSNGLVARYYEIATRLAGTQVTARP
ncbi:MAG TPA: AAA family ATPase [Terriglobia bacterium]|nr:AAA family ATPase [Terriglobia bacterium]